MILGLIVFGSGVWELQDSIASILFYLGTEETWIYNQMCRIFRGIIGLTLIVVGAILIGDKNGC